MEYDAAYKPDLDKLRENSYDTTGLFFFDIFQKAVIKLQLLWLFCPLQ